MPITIHNKEYITVAERLTKAHFDLEKIDITTEVLAFSPAVVIKATVVTKKGTFTGISGANANKSIEKESPFEVAETSAVGRALAFAGYETTNIASAEEMKKAGVSTTPTPSTPVSTQTNEFSKSVCQKCGAPIKISQAGKPYCSALCWKNPQPPIKEVVVDEGVEESMPF